MPGKVFRSEYVGNGSMSKPSKAMLPKNDGGSAASINVQKQSDGPESSAPDTDRLAAATGDPSRVTTSTRRKLKSKSIASAAQGHRRVAVLVLGMHRSGTSALTRLLGLLGCDLPKSLMGPSESNPTGHWESMAVYRLNDRILESAGSAWDDWLEFNPGWMQSPKASQFNHEALAVLKEEYDTSSLFVLKDPRICRVAPFWLNALEESGVRTAVIIPVRSPLEVAASLNRRNGFEIAYGCLLWLRHVLEAEAATRGFARIFCSYDKLLKDWCRFVAEASTALGISWPRLSDGAFAEIEAYLSESYRNHYLDNESVIENPALSKWLRESFRIFTAWVSDGEKAEDFAALDQIRSELNSAAPAFARLIALGRKATENERRLSEEVSSLKERQIDINESLAESTRTLEQLKGELAQKAAAADAANHALTDIRGKLSAAEVLATRRAERLEQAEAELVARTQEASALAAGLVELRDRISELESALAQRAAEAEEATTFLSETREKLAETQGTLVKQERQWAEERARLIRILEERESTHTMQLRETEVRAKTEVEAVRRQLEEARRLADADLKRLGEDKAAAETRLADRLGEITALTRMLQEKDVVFEAQLCETELRAKTEVEAIRRQLEEARRLADADLKRLGEDKAAAETRLADRLGEITALTRMLQEKDAALSAAHEKADQLRALLGALQISGSTWRGKVYSLLPSAWQRSRLLARIKRAGLFDPEAYLKANPDVAKSGIDPLDHYLTYGIIEGRPVLPTPEQITLKQEGRAV